MKQLLKDIQRDKASWTTMMRLSRLSAVATEAVLGRVPQLPRSMMAA